MMVVEVYAGSLSPFLKVYEYKISLVSLVYPNKTPRPSGCRQRVSGSAD